MSRNIRATCLSSNLEKLLQNIGNDEFVILRVSIVDADGVLLRGCKYSELENLKAAAC
ncbi:MAG TPA: hypothetical protein VIE65_07265 [Methylobacter sp.]|jgi:hypothetical protein